jgi:hypothetical protein
MKVSIAKQAGRVLGAIAVRTGIADLIEGYKRVAHPDPFERLLPVMLAGAGMYLAGRGTEARSTPVIGTQPPRPAPGIDLNAILPLIPVVLAALKGGGPMPDLATMLKSAIPADGAAGMSLEEMLRNGTAVPAPPPSANVNVETSKALGSLLRVCREHIEADNALNALYQKDGESIVAHPAEQKRSEETYDALVAEVDRIVAMTKPLHC